MKKTYLFMGLMLLACGYALWVGSVITGRDMFSCMYVGTMFLASACFYFNQYKTS